MVSLQLPVRSGQFAECVYSIQGSCQFCSGSEQFQINIIPIFIWKVPRKFTNTNKPSNKKSNQVVIFFHFLKILIFLKPD